MGGEYVTLPYDSEQRNYDTSKGPIWRRFEPLSAQNARLYAPLRWQSSQAELAVAEAALEGRPDGADEEGPEQSIAQQAERDDFLDSITQTEGPIALYKQNRLSGRYRRDPRQEKTILALQELYDQLRSGIRPRRPSGLTITDHVGPTKKRAHWWQGLLGGSESERPKAPRGLYMYGGVGTGKTMLMDLFAESAPPEFQLRRTTFHDFMLDVHSRLHRMERTSDPLTLVAAQLVSEFKVLCLDEFFVTDVADATMLNRLFSQMWERGLVFIATSNRAPDGLYEKGLQRDLFVPFIERLQRETVVHDISSKVDYRRLAQHRRGLFYTRHDFEDPDAEVEAQFRALADACHEAVGPTEIKVMMGRKLPIPQACGGICMFSFMDLCGKPVAAADYIALCAHFHTLVLKGVPIFKGSNRQEGYRFLTLVDVLYEHNIRLFCSSEGLPFELFQHIMTRSQANEPKVMQGAHDDDIIDDNLGFSKERCISRLTEMQSFEYLIEHARQHSPQLMLALEQASKKGGETVAGRRN
ncbi:g3705 [Coccomyxa viridis]|uniref:G3705 protein n=1 Tax=Coccomyxa viridis TaxID=1274662 RepID=A0ABP1FQ04_9CHLO